MLGDTPLIETSQYIEQTTKWLKAIGRKECVAVSFIPKMDRIMRLEQLLHDKNILKILPNTFKYIFQFFELSAPSIETKNGLCRQIASNLNSGHISNTTQTFEEWMKFFKKNNLALVLVIPEAESLLTPDHKHIFSFLSYLYDENYPHIRILSIFETQLTHPLNMKYIPPLSRIYQNVFQYPLYNNNDTYKFLNLCEELFEIKVSESEKLKISHECGGHWWFAKEAMREIANDGKWSPNTEGFIFRLQSFLASFSDYEKSLINKLIIKSENFTLDEAISLKYFKNMNLVDDANNLTIPVFSAYLKNHIVQKSEMSLSNNQIYINHIPVDTLFSKKERHILKVLLENANNLVSRDQIASYIWPTETQANYSDWAIDQHMKRLRKRIESLSLSPDMIKVVRGKGYVLTLKKQ